MLPACPVEITQCTFITDPQNNYEIKEVANVLTNYVCSIGQLAGVCI